MYSYLLPLTMVSVSSPAHGWQGEVPGASPAMLWFKHRHFNLAAS
jgi:hypothetical protein